MITKEIVIDKTEILEDGTIQVREKTRFFEDGVMTFEKNTDRRVIDPGGDTSKECTETKAIAKLIHTKEKVDAFTLKKKTKEMKNV